MTVLTSAAAEAPDGYRGDPPPDGRRILATLVVVVSVLAWLVMAWLTFAGAHGGHGQQDPAGGGTTATQVHPGHHGAAAPSPPPITPQTAPTPPTTSTTSGAASTALGGEGPAIVVLGWVVMVVAMMLPPALPFLESLRRLVGRRRHPGVLVALGATAFVSVWVVVGAGFLCADLALDALRARVPAVADRPELVAGLATVLAGLYQLTPLKRACLAACRSPRAIILARWSGRHAPALMVCDIAIRFGLVCVGCCWALMALTFAVGTAAMPVMVALAGVMALERLAPRTTLLVPAVAAGCLGLGGAVLAGVVPAGRG